MRQCILIFALLAIMTELAYTQDENVYNDMSLEELGEIDLVVTASKKLEDLFEAPLSVSIVTRDDIEKSGALSIPEALRLAPGVMVREQTSGVYDVHIRGFDNVTVTSTFPFPSNTIILVMIDNRVVYNYFAGGTFWETLPVGFNDIDRIEIVRGSASALYGPNAVAGVINIITSKPEKNGLNVTTKVAGGSYNTLRGSTSIGYKFNKKASLSVSGNAQQRDRYQNTYYHWNRYAYDRLDAITSIINPDVYLTDRPGVNYSNPEQAIKNYGLNTQIMYSILEDTKFELSTGYQKSDTQKIYVNNFATPFTENSSQTRYVDIKANFHGFISQFSYLSGNQNTNEPMWKYGFNTIDALVEYAWNYKNLDIRPGFSHRVADYDGGFTGEENVIESTAYSLLANYNLSLKHRLIGGLRVDKYRFSGKHHFSYEIGTTYRINKYNLLRFLHSKAKRAPFMVDTYMNVEIPQELATLRYIGNKNLDLLSSNTIEAGWRSKLTSRFSMDLEIFGTVLDDFSDLLYDGQNIENDTVYLDYKYHDVDYYSTQFGISFSMDYSLIDQLRIGMFGTLQKNDFHTEDENNANAAYSVNESTTPDFYGGLSVDYSPYPSLNLNLNSYYMGRQNFNGLLGTQEIPSFINMNIKVTYRDIKGFTPFLSVHNVLGSHREYGFADTIERTFVAGIHFQP